MEYANTFLLVVMVATTSLTTQQMKQCQRGSCMVVGDRETGYEYDQPVPRYLDADVRRTLGEQSWEEEGTSAGTMESQSSRAAIPHLIHMIWVGSSLPELYYRGPLSFAKLNPDHLVTVWLDHQAPDNFKKTNNIVVRNISEELFESEDLMDRSTNMAMVSDIMRVELIIKYGGIYVDIDAVARRPFGPVFDQPFVCFRPVEGGPGQSGARGLIYNHVFGMHKESEFLHFLLEVMREDFDNSGATVEKTGPHLWRKVLLVSDLSSQLQLIDWTFLMKPGHQAVVVDIPGDSVTNWWEEEENNETGPVYTIVKQMNNPRGVVILN